MSENNEYDNQETEEIAESQRLASMKSAQTLATISTIAAPVSVVFGGVFLGAIALVCGILARVKIKGIMKSTDAEQGSIVNAIYRQTLVAIILSCIALAIGIASVAYTLPILMDMMQSGEYQELLGSAATQSQGGASGSSSGTSSVWG